VFSFPIVNVRADKQGNGEWDSKVLQTLAGWVDLHSIHLYTTLGQETVPSVKGLEYENNVFGPAVSCCTESYIKLSLTT
jgi:alpha-N-arabinofuranosidase